MVGIKINQSTQHDPNFHEVAWQLGSAAWQILPKATPSEYQKVQKLSLERGYLCFALENQVRLIPFF